MEFYSAYKFSPPYGDGICWCNIIIGKRQFSPPYGDGIIKIYCWQPARQFSPPYGDGIGYMDWKEWF